VPDAAFVAVPRRQTVTTVQELASIGAGGAVCYASGFSEAGSQGAAYQQRLNAAMGDMPLIGPNCYGLLNYIDGAALWPDEQGGKRCQRGVAIISQSGNITVNLSMQQRGVPVAFLISAGNMAGIMTHDYINAMLENPNVTAIGLYLEGIAEASELSRAAIEALKKKVPIVVLESGQSEVGASVTRTHSYSLSSASEVSRSFYQRYGMIQVDSITQMLETLKLVSIVEPRANHSIASFSCSGGEAALLADYAARAKLTFAEFSIAQRQQLKAVLGDGVAVSNPLDYHTDIWGNLTAQRDCYKAVYQGTQNLTVHVIDFPTAGACDTQEWDCAVQAMIHASNEVKARVVTVATLHENCPVAYQTVLLQHGIAPMLGMPECINAIAAAVGYANKSEQATSLLPLSGACVHQDSSVLLTEYQGKSQLCQAGLSVVEGSTAHDTESAREVALKLGYPVVVKISSSKVLHKSDLNGVVLDIDSDAKLMHHATRLLQMSDEILVERQMPEPAVEMLIAIRTDPIFGRILVLGAGGKLANLMEDSCLLHFPVQKATVRQHLSQLKVGKILNGFRSAKGDMEAVLEFIMQLVGFAADDTNRIVEIEVNPLHVYGEGGGVIGVDVVYRLAV